MFFDKISSGSDYPNEINVIIEIPSNSDPIKYEFDKESGAIFVDRFIQTPMRYPANYGFIPHTLGNDGDPLDALVITRFPLWTGSVIPCRPIGVLDMEDESGFDEKIICVPKKKSDPYYAEIEDILDLSEVYRYQIKHFFERYKDLEKGKWVKVNDYKNSKEAKEILQKSLTKK